MAQGLSQVARVLLQHPDKLTKVPVLVWEAPPAPGLDAAPWMLTDGGRAPTRPRAGEPLVYSVEKVAGLKNPFAMGVTVGRVETNDIVVDDPSVSRFHAWLQFDDKVGAWSVTDAESKNGTFVDGARLAANKRTKLADSALVRFGEATMRFMLPDTLATYIQAMADRGGPP